MCATEPGEHEVRFQFLAFQCDIRVKKQEFQPLIDFLVQCVLPEGTAGFCIHLGERLAFASHLKPAADIQRGIMLPQALLDRPFNDFDDENGTHFRIKRDGIDLRSEPDVVVPATGVETGVHRRKTIADRVQIDISRPAGRLVTFIKVVGFGPLRFFELLQIGNVIEVAETILVRYEAARVQFTLQLTGKAGRQCHAGYQHKQHA